MDIRNARLVTSPPGPMSDTDPHRNVKVTDRFLSGSGLSEEDKKLVKAVSDAGGHWGHLLSQLKLDRGSGALPEGAEVSSGSPRGWGPWRFRVLRESLSRTQVGFGLLTLSGGSAACITPSKC